MNAGMSTRRSISGSSWRTRKLSLASSENSFKSLSRTLARMNTRNGVLMRVYASFSLILDSMSG